MAETCTKCKEQLMIVQIDEARGKIIKACNNSKCSMYGQPISFSERQVENNGGKRMMLTIVEKRECGVCGKMRPNTPEKCPHCQNNG